MASKIDVLLDKYGESHQNKTNKLIHWICVPLIFYSIVALIWSIPFPFDWATNFNWASVVLLLILVYYFRLSVSLALGMMLFAFICMTGCIFLSRVSDSFLWQSAIGIFVIAWIFQFVGHKIEGKKPSFLEDLQYLLIGPAWLMHFLYKKVGIPY